MNEQLDDESCVPNEPYSSIYVSSNEGNAEISNLNIYSLNPANNNLLKQIIKKIS